MWIYGKRLTVHTSQDGKVLCMTCGSTYSLKMSYHLHRTRLGYYICQECVGRYIKCPLCKELVYGGDIESDGICVYCKYDPDYI